MVAETFLDEPTDETMTVNHKNRARDNNNVTNLEWATPREQALHSHRSGTRKKPTCRGRKVEQYDLKENLIQVFASVADAGRRSGTHAFEIYAGCNGTLKAARGHSWKFP